MDLFIGIFAGPLSSLIGTRAVVMMSGLMAGCSLILSSFASGLPQITLILAFGLGNNFARLSLSRNDKPNFSRLMIGKGTGNYW